MTDGDKPVNALLELNEAAKVAQEALPEIEELCLSWPLYRTAKISSKFFLTNLRTGRCQFDAHCIECRKESTFRTMRSSGSGSGSSRDNDWMLKPGFIDLHVYCQRDSRHNYLFSFYYDGGSLVKFGQIPSLEDIAGADIRKYEKLLPDGYFSELKRATGLASHGVGIGAFVYLRRIFERLIHDHHASLSEPIAGFDQKRMDERIDLLSAVLPAALVENKAAYGILSVGIHELDEESCRKYFPVVRQAIITILEEDYREKQRQEEGRRLRDEIAKVAGEVRSKK